MPVIIAWAAPAVLELVVPVLFAAPVPLAVPVVLVLLTADALFPLEVFEAVGALLVVAGEAELEVVEPAKLAVAAKPRTVSDGRELVMVTAMEVNSVGSRVVVDSPGSFASSPPKDSVQTAEPPVIVQSM